VASGESFLRIKFRASQLRLLFSSSAVGLIKASLLRFNAK
jgi:hypothetical protein